MTDDRPPLDTPGAFRVNRVVGAEPRNAGRLWSLAAVLAATITALAVGVEPPVVAAGLLVTAAVLAVASKPLAARLAPRIARRRLRRRTR